KANTKPTKWGLFEDSPDKLLLDLRKARLKRDQEEAGRALAEARKLFEQGSLTEAERQAHRAERLHGPYSVWDLGDRPQKLLAEIDTTRRKSKKPKIPAAPAELVKKDSEKKTPEKPAIEVVKKDPEKKPLAKPAVALQNPPAPVWPEAKEPVANRVQQIA